MAKQKNPTRPEDTNQLAKLIADIATGKVKEKTPKPPKPDKRRKENRGSK